MSFTPIFEMNVLVPWFPLVIQIYVTMPNLGAAVVSSRLRAQQCTYNWRERSEVANLNTSAGKCYVVASAAKCLPSARAKRTDQPQIRLSEVVIFCPSPISWWTCTRQPRHTHRCERTLDGGRRTRLRKGCLARVSLWGQASLSGVDLRIAVLV